MTQNTFLETSINISTQIIVSDEPPIDGSGIFLHYEFNRLNVSGWEMQDIRDIVSQNEDIWLSNIENWHKELCKNASELTQWWWLLPASRLILWKTVTPFSLKPIIFTL